MSKDKEDKDKIKQEKNREHQKKTAYKTILQKTFLVFVYNSLGYEITFMKRRKTKIVKDYKIEYIKQRKKGKEEILIDYYLSMKNMEKIMKKEKKGVKNEEIKKCVNFKIINLMIDNLIVIGFQIDNSPYKKGDYSLRSNYRIHSIKFPKDYIKKISQQLVPYINITETKFKNLFSSVNQGILTENDVDLIGEIYLNKHFNIIL